MSLTMHKSEPRNFDCPETEKPCIDDRCTTERCYEEARLAVAVKREEAASKQRKFHAEVWEIIKPFFKGK
jgi:hypothetical protein